MGRELPSYLMDQSSLFQDAEHGLLFPSSNIFRLCFPCLLCVGDLREIFHANIPPACRALDPRRPESHSSAELVLGDISEEG